MFTPGICRGRPKASRTPSAPDAASPSSPGGVFASYETKCVHMAFVPAVAPPFPESGEPCRGLAKRTSTSSTSAAAERLGMLASHKSPYSGAWYPDEGTGPRFATLRTLPGVGTPYWPVSVPRRPRLRRTACRTRLPPGRSPRRSIARIERQRPQRIVILAFPHHGGLRGVVAPDCERIATPLGEATLDGDFAGFPRLPEANVCDHSLEIQLPFLQRSRPMPA